MDIKFIENVHNFVYKQIKVFVTININHVVQNMYFYCYSFVNGFNLKHCLKCVLLYLSSDNFYLNIIA